MYFELHQFSGFELKKHWLRGGYPDSYLAEKDDISKLWLENYIRTYI